MEKKRRLGIVIMARLIGLVLPLAHIMVVAVILGVLGYLCATFITIFAAKAVLSGSADVAVKLFVAMGVMAVARGLLHYVEQYCNHYIAFKLLAIIRHKVFAVLRKLAPAKLEGREKGNLISIITSDIELLEVFYAHTISPICIAVLTCAVMVGFIGHFDIGAGMIAFIGYMIVGVAIPCINGRLGKDAGMEYRTRFGALNSFVLDSLRGIDETMQYGRGEKRKGELDDKSKSLASLKEKLSVNESVQGMITKACILLFSFIMFVYMLSMQQKGAVSFEALVLCVVAMMGSFGPVVALASLSNNLTQTLASAERILSLLEEKPQVEEISGGENAGEFSGAEAKDISFAYKDEKILEDFSINFEKGKIIGIHGQSGCGKSTLLKLLMRFWDVNSGRVLVSGEDIRCMPTRKLRSMQSYVTQETHLFSGTIAGNIAIGRPDATKSQIEEAAKKASIHDFIMSLPEGYETKVGELGDTLSSGEKQRIGIARAFLSDAPFMLFDEPTSNLDSLNEGIVLSALKEACEEKTVVIVSHRQSTMGISDVLYEMRTDRVS